MKKFAFISAGIPALLATAPGQRAPAQWLPLLPSLPRNPHPRRMNGRPSWHHDFHATIIHQMGINHERLTFRTQGRDFRLTYVAGKVVRSLGA